MKLLAVITALALLVVARPSFAQIATETDASFGYCEGCDDGNVILTMDGGEAKVFGLSFDADAGDWVGVGSLVYNRSGVSINDLGATFRVVLMDSPSAAKAGCTRATKLVESFEVLGSKASGSYLLSISDVLVDETTYCASEKCSVSIDPSPHAIGKIKKTMGIKPGRVSISGRIFKP